MSLLTEPDNMWNRPMLMARMQADDFLSPGARSPLTELDGGTLPWEIMQTDGFYIQPTPFPADRQSAFYRVRGSVLCFML